MVSIGAFYRSTVGKKIIMAVTGVILVGFIVAHVAANLLVFTGSPDKLDAYARFLRSTGELLWVARGILLISVILHIDAAWKLTRRSHAARPVGYRRKRHEAATLASRTMRWGGVLLLVFIVYHLLHLTFGVAHPTWPRFDHSTVYRNVIVGFQSPWVVVFYEAGLIALGLHLYHGMQNMLLSLGLTNPRWVGLWKRLAMTVAVLVAIGFLVIPLAVYFGVVS